jgi:DNA-binding response OmpR family regulator
MTEEQRGIGIAQPIRVGQVPTERGNGAGPGGIGIAQLLLQAGFQHILICDRLGIINHYRLHNMNWLLDVMMPRIDGFTICQRVREFSTVPIIIVTTRGQDQDKVRGLDLGADDYLTRPFSTDELLARVRATLRRAQFSAREEGKNGHVVLFSF